MPDLTLKDLLRQDKEVESDSPSIDLGPIKRLLGDELPDIDESQVGRIRLVRALVQKFGNGYRAHKAAREALDHYDKESRDIKTFKKALRDVYARK